MPGRKQTIQDHDVVFLAGIPDTEEALLEAYCYKHNKTIYLLAELEDVVISTAQQNILDDAPFLFIHRMELTLTQMFLKRACDIVISMERAQEQATLYGHPLQREVAFLTVHSMLHLLGYDHENGGLEAMRMREKEEAVLTQLGLPRTVSYTE